MEKHLLKLRADAEEWSRNSKLAADPQKRELFARLAQHFNVLASEVARAIAAKALTTPPEAIQPVTSLPMEVLDGVGGESSLPPFGHVTGAWENFYTAKTQIF